MKTKSSKKAHRAPTITQLVADRNKVALERIAYEQRQEALKREHKLWPEPAGLGSMVHVVDETFPQGWPYYTLGREVTFDGINEAGNKEIELAKACGAHADDLQCMGETLQARLDWDRTKCKERWDTYYAAAIKVGIDIHGVCEEKLYERLCDLDEEIVRTPARTAGELMAKARRVAKWVLCDCVSRGETYTGLLTAGKKRIGELYLPEECFVQLYRDLERMVPKLGGPPLELVVED